MKTLSLIIPVYNEEKTLKSIVEKTLKIADSAFFKENNLALELVLVDDCSKDNSSLVIEELKNEFSNIKTFKHEKNKGKGAALKTGFLGASGDFIGIQDADNEYNPYDYIKLLKPLMEDRADVSYGSRYLKKESRKVLYFWHSLMNKTLSFLTSMVTNLDITGMETCYKLFKKEVIEKITPKLKENRFGFEPEITVYVAKNNYRVYETAIDYNPRSYEEGKKINAKDGLRALYCIFHYGANIAPSFLQFIIFVLLCYLSLGLCNCSFFLISNCTDNSIITITLPFVVFMVINYLLVSNILFSSKIRYSKIIEIILFILNLTITSLISYGIMFLLLYILDKSIVQYFNMPLWLIVSFLINKMIIFKEK